MRPLHELMVAPSSLGTEGVGADVFGLNTGFPRDVLGFDPSRISKIALEKPLIFFRSIDQFIH